VSGSFGGGVLSRFEKTGGDSFGGTELARVRNRRAIIAVLLIAVLKGLGGASQEDQQPALVLEAHFPQPQSSSEFKLQFAFFRARTN
jgi:hypothetical protein